MDRAILAPLLFSLVAAAVTTFGLVAIRQRKD